VDARAVALVEAEVRSRRLPAPARVHGGLVVAGKKAPGSLTFPFSCCTIVLEQHLHKALDVFEEKRKQYDARLVAIDTRSGVPLYRQIIDQILIAISTGQLKPGDKLPTVRHLAIDIQVNPNTVSRAYRELEIHRVVTTQRGTGTFVAAEPPAAQDQAVRRVRLEKYCDAITAETGKMGFALAELVEALQDRLSERR
jgi:GntR family transcriptional regulator